MAFVYRGIRRCLSRSGQACSARLPAPARVHARFLSGAGRHEDSDAVAEALAACAGKPPREFLASLARAVDVKAGKLPEGGFAWVLVPIGAEASATPIASLRSTPSGVLFGAATHPALPLVAVRPLLDAALDEEPERFALAALPGLCQWAVKVIAEENGDLKDKFGEWIWRVVERARARARERDQELTRGAGAGDVAVGAGEAIALHRPREGHSVLGQGTFRDARPIW